jgi:Lar family restriction alleviation protein
MSGSVSLINGHIDPDTNGMTPQEAINTLNYLCKGISNLRTLDAITMANELKPCPFCGGTDISCADAGYKTDIWFVQCEDCGATFPHFDSKEEAIDHWNRRATDGE